MTAMQEAFKNAKPLNKSPVLTEPRKITLLEKVWLWVRDHPRRTSAEYAKVLGASSGLTLLSLLDRGMVLTETVPNPLTGRDARVFWVNPKMGGVYEQWPGSGKPKPKAPPVQVATTPVQTQQVLQSPAAAPQGPIPKAQQAAPREGMQQIPPCLQNLTMQESLEAYKYLKKLFG